MSHFLKNSCSVKRSWPNADFILFTSLSHAFQWPSMFPNSVRSGRLIVDVEIRICTASQAEQSKPRLLNHQTCKAVSGTGARVFGVQSSVSRNSSCLCMITKGSGAAGSS